MRAHRRNGMTRDEKLERGFGVLIGITAGCAMGILGRTYMGERSWALVAASFIGTIAFAVYAILSDTGLS